MKLSFAHFVAAAAAAVALSPSLASASNLDFRMVNQTDQPIVAMWATPMGQRGWGRMFNNTFVPNSGFQAVHFSDAAYDASECYYDLRIQFSEGQVESFTRVNLCRINGVRVYVANGEVQAQSF